MIKHILKLIWNGRRQNIWIWAELMVVSVCLWYAVDYLYTVTANSALPLGFDSKNVYCITTGALTPESERYNPDSLHTTDVTADYLSFVDHLRHHPAVEDVCYTQMHQHYVWMNSGISFRYDTIRQHSYIRYVSPSYFNVFRVKTATGGAPADLVEKMDRNGVILTADLASKLFRGQQAEGKEVVSNYPDSIKTVLAVCEPQKYNEYTSHIEASYFPIFFGAEAPNSLGKASSMKLYIRVKDGHHPSSFLRDFRKEMHDRLMIGNLYMQDIRPMSHYRDEHLKDYRNDLYTHIAIAFFFIVNVFFAVLGVFWFRTQHRRAELGLRVALGGSMVSLRQLLLGEGLILLTLAFIPAVIFCLNLVYMRIVSEYPVAYSAVRFLTGIVVTYLLMAIIITIGIWFPARQAMKIQPAEALREE